MTHPVPSVAPAPLADVPLRAVGAGLVAGLVGTTLMTATLWAERRVRRHHRGPVDYDASGHVVTAIATVLRVDPDSRARRRLLFLLAHWGYGSFVGLGYPPLRRLLGDEARATAVYYAACQAMACTLFPLCGGTPPPWRWRRDLMVSSLAQHAVYAAAVTTTYDRLAPRAEARRPRPT